jgi:hypothetical protein
MGEAHKWFWWGRLKEEELMEDLDVDWRIIL